MNRCELIAFDYLTMKGVNVIDNTGRGTPDFLGDYKNYEVKRLYKKYLLFRETQLAAVRKNCDIIVVDDGKVISIANFEDTKKKFKIILVPVFKGKSIHLHLDDKVFYRMNQDKTKKEAEAGHKITWEEYVRLIFGLQK